MWHLFGFIVSEEDGIEPRDLYHLYELASVFWGLMALKMTFGIQNN